MNNQLFFCFFVNFGNYFLKRDILITVFLRKRERKKEKKGKKGELKRKIQRKERGGKSL